MPAPPAAANRTDARSRRDALRRATVVGTTSTLAVPLCVPCNQRWSQAVTAITIAALALVGSIRVLLLGHLDHPVPALALFGVVLGGFVAVLLAFVKPRMLQVDRIDDREIRLKGFSPRAAEDVTRALG